MSRSPHASDTHAVLFSTPLPKGCRVHLGEGLFYEAGGDTELTVTTPKNEHFPLLEWLRAHAPASDAPVSDTASSEREGASGGHGEGG
jgi:hypothetical protein